MAETTLPIPPEKLKQALNKHLFVDPNLKAYAILDGASVEGVLDKLGQENPEHVCLYRGEMEPDLAECAPYLIALKEGTPFTDWVLQEGWGKHWGIFALAATDLKETRKHFRTFLIVKDPDGKKLYFRYYDPRVLRIYLPTCNAQELKAVFGPVQAYLFEDEAPSTLLRFSTPNGDLRKEAVNLMTGQ
jgi:hypothetical protein